MLNSTYSSLTLFWSARDFEDVWGYEKSGLKFYPTLFVKWNCECRSPVPRPALWHEVRLRLLHWTGWSHESCGLFLWQVDWFYFGIFHCFYSRGGSLWNSWVSHMRFNSVLLIFAHSTVSFRQACMNRPENPVRMGYLKLLKRITHDQRKSKSEAHPSPSFRLIFALRV